MQLSDYSLTALFAYSLKKYDNAPFLSYVDGPVLTYRQFARLVAALHRFFGEKGVRRGDRILLLGRNQPRWGAAYFAAVTFGAVLLIARRRRIARRHTPNPDYLCRFIIWNSVLKSETIR